MLQDTRVCPPGPFSCRCLDVAAEDIRAAEAPYSESRQETDPQRRETDSQRQEADLQREEHRCSLDERKQRFKLEIDERIQRLALASADRRVLRWAMIALAVGIPVTILGAVFCVYAGNGVILIALFLGAANACVAALGIIASTCSSCNSAGGPSDGK